MAKRKSEVKLVLLGETLVGKTALLNRILYDKYGDNTQVTIGANFFTKQIEDDNDILYLHMWDTAGQEKYKSITPIYCRDAKIGFIVYSVVDKETFENVDFWASKLIDNSGCKVLLFLIGNKIDLPRDENGVTLEEGKSKAEEIGAIFYEVSAKTGTGIDELVQMTFQEFVDSNFKQNTPVIVDIENTGDPNPRGCC